MIDYGLDHLDEDNLEDYLIHLIKLNKSDIDNIDVNIEDNKIYINLSENNKGMFSGFVNISIFNVKTSYVGYIENNEKRIEKMGD